MARDFITMTLSRAVHEELFRQLLQHDARAAANAMEMGYEEDDVQELEAIHLQIRDLDSDHARQLLQGILAQVQNIYGGPQRREDFM
jgi:hypothetical protein